MCFFFVFIKLFGPLCGRFLYKERGEFVRCVVGGGGSTIFSCATGINSEKKGFLKRLIGFLRET